MVRLQLKLRKTYELEVEIDVSDDAVAGLDEKEKQEFARRYYLANRAPRCEGKVVDKSTKIDVIGFKSFPKPDPVKKRLDDDDSEDDENDL